MRRRPAGGLAVAAWRGVAVLALAAAARAGAADAPVHHVLEVMLDPSARALRGIDSVVLRGGRHAAFALLRGFTVDRLVVDGEPVAAGTGSGLVRLALDARAEHRVVVEYRGVLGIPPHPGAVAGPDGSYLPPARWFPSFGGPFTYEVTLDVPDPQRAVTSGRLTEETIAGGRYRATFAADAPALELAAFAGPYRVTERIHRGWRLRTYLHDTVADLAERYLGRTAEYLDLYDGWIGTYPWSGFAVVSSPLPVGLGFPGLTYVGAEVLRLPFIPDTSLGHEVLHSWWGSGVRPGAGGNWAEGLTTCMADYTFVERRGAEPARDERLAWLREFAILPAAEDRPLTAFEGRSHSASQATGYHKAAFVFVMLRDEIGSEAFASGVRRFWQAHRFGSATWDDLEHAFSAAAGLPLRQFFQQWVRRPGAPQLALRHAETGGDRVTFTLTQSAPPYALAVPVTLDTGGGPIARTVRLDEPAREYALDVVGPARSLAVDPDLRLFRRLDRAEIPPIIREVAFDPAAAAVIAARDEASRTAAREVAARLFEREPAVVDAGAGPLPSRPLLVAGTTAEVTALLAASGTQGVPEAVAGKGTARAWAARRSGGAPLVVVAADRADALRAVARPLPHYGAQSWAVFDGARVIGRGLWPPAASTLRVELGSGDATRSLR